MSSPLYVTAYISTHVKFEVYTAVTMKNAVFWVLKRATRLTIPEDGILQASTQSPECFVTG
jgi:hypothetical protein